MTYIVKKYSSRLYGVYNAETGELLSGGFFHKSSAAIEARIATRKAEQRSRVLAIFTEAKI